MIKKRKIHDLLRKSALICGLFLFSPGCVSIYDSVNVQKPEGVDQYQRNILDKCTPHSLPHRVILAQMSAVNPTIVGEGVDVNDQQGFDGIWNSIQPIPDPNNDVPTYALKPVVNWDVQTVHFVPILYTNTCDKFKPLAMETDCYNINIIIYKYVEGTNCTTPTTSPVLIYIFPKTPFPIAMKWSKTPDYQPTPQP